MSINRERKWHDDLARKGFRSRRLVQRLTRPFYNQRIMWGPIFREMGDLAGRRVLDYGCGRGKFALLLAARGAQVIGIDISKEVFTRVARGKGQGSGQVQFVVGDAHQTGLASGLFDFVVGNGILHHLDVTRSYREVHRLLKPGAKAFFVEPLASHPLLRAIRALTPSARTRDEHPLRFADIDGARSIFSCVEHRELFLLSVAIFPLALFSPRTASLLLALLRPLDQLIFRVIPATRRYAWVTVITLVR